MNEEGLTQETRLTPDSRNLRSDSAHNIMSHKLLLSFDENVNINFSFACEMMLPWQRFLKGKVPRLVRATRHPRYLKGNKRFNCEVRE